MQIYKQSLGQGPKPRSSLSQGNTLITGLMTHVPLVYLFSGLPYEFNFGTREVESAIIPA